MTAEEFCAANAIEMADLVEMAEIARDCVSAAISEYKIEKTFEPDDSLTIIVHPGVNKTVAAQLLWLLARSPRWEQLREQTHRKIFVRCAA